jgi:hypothetical protein
MFMFFKRRVTGLQPSQRYTLQTTVRIASGAASGGVGIGGSPAESVYLKAGASAIEPLPTNRNGFIALNVDKGIQSQEGTNAVVLGTIGVDLPQGAAFVFKTLPASTDTKTLDVVTASDGSLWLFIGTDSGFEGLTQLYYDMITVKCTLKQ